MKNIFKSVWAVLAGFFVVGVLSVVMDMIVEGIGLLPPADQPEAYLWWHLVVALIYRLAFTILGGYVTAKLSPSNPLKHVIILAVLGTIAGTLGTVANWEKAAMAGAWYPVLLLLLSPLAIWWGGKLQIKK